MCEDQARPDLKPRDPESKKSKRKTSRAAPSSKPNVAYTTPTGTPGQKYQRILDAAVEVIAENGYFNSPISAIAARAGVADGTVYLYFKSKDDVLRAAIDASFARFYNQVEECFKTLHDPRRQLEYIACLHLSSAQTDRSMAILMQTEMRQSARYIADFSIKHLMHYIQVVREVIRRGQQQSIFRADISAALVAQFMFGAVDDLLGSSLFGARDYDPEATAAQVIDLLLHGIGQAPSSAALAVQVET